MARNNSENPPLNSEVSARLDRQQTAGERHRARRARPSAEYKDAGHRRTTSGAYEPSLSGRFGGQSMSPEIVEDIVGDSNFVEDVVSVPIEPFEEHPGNAAELMTDLDAAPLQALPLLPDLEEAEIPEKHPVNATAEIAAEIEAVTELDAQAATLQALSLLPELEGEELPTSPAAYGDSHVRKPVDFLFIGVHGIGADSKSLVQSKKDLKEHLKFIQAHWFWELEFKTHVELIDWKSDILPRQMAAFSRILPHLDRYKKYPTTGSKASTMTRSRDTLRPTFLEDPRYLLTDHISDLLSFMTPDHGNFIVESVANHINETVKALREDILSDSRLIESIHTLLQRSQSRFEESKIVLIGHSLGGIILYELLTGHRLRPGPPPVTIPQLQFQPDFFFMWGAPLSAFCVLNDPSFALHPPVLPTQVRVYNVFHPCDPVGFRFEPLFFSALDPVPPPVRLPNWRTNGAKEYWQWEKDFATAKKAIKNFWADAGDKFRTMFGGKVKGEYGQEYEVPGIESPEAPSEVSGLSWRGPKRCICQRLNAESRYGTHDRKVTAGRLAMAKGRSMLKATSRPISNLSGDTATQEGAPSWLGGKRKVATVDNLMKLLNIPEKEKDAVIEKLATGREDESTNDSLARPQAIAIEDTEILSEVEEGGGLELPVRLDFQLQEELPERYISQLGTLQSHFNYWLSRDAVFFMLKEVTNFRPRLSYPDFLQILEYSENHKPTEASTTEPAETEPPIAIEPTPEEVMLPEPAPPDPNRLEAPELPPMKRLQTRTLKRAPAEQQQDRHGEQVAAEAGKAFFG